MDHLLDDNELDNEDIEPVKKNLRYYLDLPYTRELIPEPEGGWFIRIKELPGCMSQGDHAEEAIVMIEDAMLTWLLSAMLTGDVIPEPVPFEDRREWHHRDAWTE